LSELVKTAAREEMAEKRRLEGERALRAKAEESAKLEAERRNTFAYRVAQEVERQLAGMGIKPPQP
jgi:hypothetical protein